MLFGWAAYSVSNFTGILTDCSLTCLQKASEKLWEHFEGVGCNTAKKYYLEAVKKAETFKKIMENKQTPVDQQLSKIHAQNS